jgi:alpha-tubulin suppressor-like RCC1 family protein
MGDSLPTVDLGAGRSAVEVVAGFDHTCALLDDGTVKCWGDNQFGQLGLGDTWPRGGSPGEMGDALPEVQLGSTNTVLTLRAGGVHTCALFSGGKVKCWGQNFEGQLGLGDDQNRGEHPDEMGDALPFVDLGSGRTVKWLARGLSHDTCALLDDSSVKCWGQNFQGILGLGSGSNRGADPNQMGDALPPLDLGLGYALQVVTGLDQTCAILSDRSTRCWGSNADGALGLGRYDELGDEPGEMGENLPAVELGTGRTARSLTAGSGYNCALLDDGTVKCWGYNDSAALGLGDTANRGLNSGEMGDALPTVMVP